MDDKPKVDPWKKVIDQSIKEWLASLDKQAWVVLSPGKTRKVYVNKKGDDNQPKRITDAETGKFIEFFDEAAEFTPEIQQKVIDRLKKGDDDGSHGSRS